jgi:hypothetical protein
MTRSDARLAPRINRPARPQHPLRWVAATLVLSCAAVAGPCAAQSGIIDQVWVGAFAHDVSNTGANDPKESGTEDTLLEVDTVRPGLLRAIGAPRIGFSALLNSAGLTNSGAVSLVWDHRLFSRLRGTVGFGMGLSDGVTNPPPGAAGVYDTEHRVLLGSKVLFREAAGLDWSLTRYWSIGGEFIHMSNGLILGKAHNEGINDAGIRLGYHF